MRIAQIANSFQISENHLVKVVHLLGQCGCLSNTCGRGGELSLAKSPRNIGITAVVRWTQDANRPAKCFGKKVDQCTIAHICYLRRVLSDAVDAFYGVLDGYTLGDLVENRKSVGQALFGDRAFSYGRTA